MFNKSRRPSSSELFSGVRAGIYERFPNIDSSNTWFINLYNGLGDVFYVLAYLREFRRIHKVKYLVVVYRSSVQDVVDMYREDFDATVPLKSDFPLDKTLSEFGPNLLICPSKAFVYEGAWIDLAKGNRVPVTDWYKFGLRLPMTSKFQPPNYQPVDTSHLIRNQVKKIVLFFPYTGFGKRLDKNDWKHIIEAFPDDEYVKYTNCKNTTWDSTNASTQNEILNEYEPLPGTESLTCSLKEVFSIAKQGAIAVCAYGGMATILAFLVEKIILVQKVQVYENAGIFNSSHEGERWTSLDMSGTCLKKDLPFLKNLLEIDINNNAGKKIENFLKD